MGRGLVIAAIVGALAWAAEPFFRRQILFEEPLPLSVGSSVAGTFTPNLAADRVKVEVRFAEAGRYPQSEPHPAREAAADRLAEAIRGDWKGTDARPAGLRIRARVEAPGQAPREYATDEHLTGDFGPAYVSVHVAHIDPHAEVEHRVEVRVEHAVEALATWDARLVVVNAGDWWNYRTLERTFRPLVLLLIGLVALGVWVAVCLRRRRVQY